MLPDTIFHNNELQLKFKWMKMEKHKHIIKMKKLPYPIVIILASLILINAFVTYSSCNYRLYALATNATAAEATTTNTTTTKFNDTAALFLMINFEDHFEDGPDPEYWDGL
jgi:ribose/xylose/arabinose/galactoside ABC-type transport system permease subunit